MLLKTTLQRLYVGTTTSLAALIWSTLLGASVLLILSHFHAYLLLPTSGPSYFQDYRLVFDHWASIEYVAFAIEVGLVCGLWSFWRAYEYIRSFGR